MPKKYVALCLASAIIGAVAASAWRDWSPPPLAIAQEVQLPPDSRLGRSSAARGRFLTPRTSSSSAELSPDEEINVAVYENVNRSVVNINTKAVRSDAFFLFDVPSEGAGSGSVLDEEGHILTNYHVIENAREIMVTLFDGRSYDAQLVGRDLSNDVAVIKVNAPAASLFPVAFGDSSQLKVGQRALAIGNPFGLERTLTTGIISSLNRSLPSRNRRTIKSVIQTDAAINPGNSGGPLLDRRGRLIGMTTAIAGRTGNNTGVGFAIPVSTIERIVPQLIQNGRVIRPETGIAGALETEEGLLIHTLTPGGPAEEAGMRGPRIIRERRREGPVVYERLRIDRSAADLIIAVDGQPVTSVDELLTIIERKRPGAKAVFSVIRDNRQKDIELTLGEGES